MGRHSRSRSRSRDRRVSSRERRSYRSKSRDRHDRSRELDRRRSRSRDQRDKDRPRSRSRSPGDNRSRRPRSGSGSRDKVRERDRERERDSDRGRSTREEHSGSSNAHHKASTTTTTPPPAQQQQQQAGVGAEADRLARLAAWKARQLAAAGTQAAVAASAPAAAAPAGALAYSAAAVPEVKVWMPWEDPSALACDSAGPSAASTPAPVGATASVAVPRSELRVAASEEDEAEEEDPDAAAAAAEAREAAIRERMRLDRTYVPPNVAAKRAKDMADDLARKIAEGEQEEDSLDAFMAAAVLPEVEQRQAEEEARRQAERHKLAEHLATGKAPPPLKVLEESDDEDPDANPDMEIQIPAKKVKLMIGPGGEKIKEIQKKSKCRIQVKKDEKELNRGFGAGFKLDVEELMQSASGEKKLTTIMLFGDEKAVETAERMIMEAIDNKEQKQKNRQKEYDRKRETKRRERLLYHLRHAKDYEILEVSLGASKLDVKKAYRRLAMQWHPDKHIDNSDVAKAKFQEIQKAYDSLMTTSEDDIIEQLADKPQAAT